MNTSNSITRLIFSFIFFLLAIKPISINAQELSKKWFPGHYVQIRYYTNPVSENIRDLVKDNPYITGYKVHIVWNEIEKAKGGQ
jgi:hypothetical protein